MPKSRRRVTGAADPIVIFAAPLHPFSVLGASGPDAQPTSDPRSRVGIHALDDPAQQPSIGLVAGQDPDNLGQGWDLSGIPGNITVTNATLWLYYVDEDAGGRDNTYTVSVFDRQGNKRTAETTVVPSPVGNRAPQPFVTLSSPTVFAGQNLALNAGESSDPGGNNAAVQVGLYGNRPISVPSQRIHVACNTRRTSVANFTRWFQTDGNTHVFRVFDG